MRRLLMVLIAVLAVCLSANGQTNEYYYLRNVGTGKWLGPGNNVGVQASLTDVAYWVKFQNANNGYAVMKDEPLPAGRYRDASFICIFYSIVHQIDKYLFYPDLVTHKP